MASEVNFSNLISLTSAGLKVAPYPKILQYLITRYKEAFGDDIKIDNTSADGIFLHNTALEINNILQMMEQIYASFNINDATGKALDNLCSLANIYRKSATNSIAQVIITNNGDEAITFEDNYVEAVDKAGIMWKYDGTISLSPNESRSISLICEDKGAISAPANWIYQITNAPNNSIISISQPSAAIIGENEESDRELKSRKNQSSSLVGITTLDSLVGALLQIEGVQDVLIYNNVIDSQGIAADDTTPIPYHNIYIILKQSDLADDLLIGRTIYTKLTPGILTTPMKSGIASGTSKSVQYFPAIYGVDNDQYSVNIYWKKAIAIHPTITITFNPVNQYCVKEFMENTIGKGLIEYINALRLSSNLNEDDLSLQTYDLDPRFEGKFDFTIDGITIASPGENNPDTFFNYTTATWSTANNTKTLTLA